MMPMNGPSGGGDHYQSGFMVSLIKSCVSRGVDQVEGCCFHLPLMMHCRVAGGN